MKSFFHDVKIDKVQDHTAAGTSSVTTASVNCAGYEGVAFLTSFGTAASGNTGKIQVSSDDGASDDFSDVAGTSVTTGTSDEDVLMDYRRPHKQYVRAVYARGTSSTLESVWAFRYGAKSAPVTNVVSGTLIGEFTDSASEGTA